jgi:putative peptidoglycan lipid II flippase
MSIARNLATVGSATLLSRLLGFIRDAGVAALLGAGPLADAYVAALQIPNLFRRLLADGALNSAFVPMWLRIRKDTGFGGAWQFGGRVAATMFLGLIVLTLLCNFFAPAIVAMIAPGFNPHGDRFDVAATLLRFAVPYIAVAGLVAIAAAILNAEGRVAAAAGGVVAFNCVLVAAVVAIAMMNHGPGFAAAFLAISFVISGAVQLLVVGVALFRLRGRAARPTSTNSIDVGGFYTRALPAVIAAGTPQLVLIAGTIVASPSPSAASWLYYASRLYELPLGIIAIAIAAVLTPKIAASVLANDRETIAAAQSRAFEITLGIALPAAGGLAILSMLIVGVLFQRGAFGAEDTSAVADALTAISAGLAGYALEKVLSAISFAHEDARTPMLTALAGLAASAATATMLFPRYGHVGVAAAIALSGWVSALLLAIGLWQRGWIKLERSVGLRILGIAGSAFVMGAIVAFAIMMATMQFGEPITFIRRLVWLGLLIGLGLAVYLGSLRLFGIADIRKLVAAARAGL